MPSFPSMGGGSICATTTLAAAFQAELEASSQSDNFVGLAANGAQPTWHSLALLARRVVRSTSRLATAWIACCREHAGLHAEHPGYPDALRRAAGPLIEALAAGRTQLAELHAIELFNELEALSLDSAAIVLVVECFAAAVSQLVPNADCAHECRVLTQLLSSIASDVSGRNPSPQVLLESHDRPRVDARNPCPLPELIGASSAMRALREQVLDLASAPGTLLIAGESGTGKEVVAQALHRLGAEHARPLLAVNCSALPPELIESELFGHERGAFTGSRESAPGLLRAAADGTVFLDEVTEMPLALQPKLLRALEQRAVRPVGGLRELPIKARIVAATNRDPEHAMRSGHLRADLFYRLCVHRIDVPALRERMDDVPLLVAHFLRGLALGGHRVPRGFSGEALALLMAHDWPGNVRELKNLVEHCSARAKTGYVMPEHLPRSLRPRPSTAVSGDHPIASARPRSVPPGPGVARIAAARAVSDAPPAANDVQLPPLHQVEREHIARVLRVCDGNKTQAAQMLGLSRHQLYLRLERLGLGRR